MNGCINSLQYGIVFLRARCNNQKSVRNIFEQSYRLQGLSIIEYCQGRQVQLPFASSETFVLSLQLEWQKIDQNKNIHSQPR